MEGSRGGVTIVTNSRGHQVIALDLRLNQVVLDDGRLSGTGDTDEEHRLDALHVQVKHVLVLLNVDTGHDNVLVHDLDPRNRFVGLYKVVPVHPFLAGRIEDVVLWGAMKRKTGE